MLKSNFKHLFDRDILCALPTAMIGYQIHSSFFWGVVDFVFWPIVWIKWLILHEVSLSIIKETFSFLLN